METRDMPNGMTHLTSLIQESWRTMHEEAVDKFRLLRSRVKRALEGPVICIMRFQYSVGQWLATIARCLDPQLSQISIKHGTSNSLTIKIKVQNFRNY